jgi:hypothetical protein
MSRRSIHDPEPWTPEEDAILMASWPDPDMDFAAIAELIPRPRSEGAVKHRGYKIGLGKKTQRPKTKEPGNDSKAWPADMPAFEDHPKAVAPGSLAKAARLGSRFKSSSHDAEASRTGSSLDGASIHPTGRRV